MATDFDGVDDYIDCGSSASLDDITAADLSASFWVYLDTIDANSYGRLICKGPSNAGWSVYIINDGTYTKSLAFNQSWSGTAGSNAYWYAPANSMSTGAWKHVVVTYNGGASGNDPSFYINGSSVATGEAAAPQTNRVSDAISNLKVATYDSSGYDTDGRLEDVRVFNRILSANEVATLANGYRGPLGGEVLWLPMDEMDGVALSSLGTAVFDMSGNGNNGTPQGGPMGQASFAPRSQGWIP